MGEPDERPQFSADDFFASQPPPAHLEEHLDAVRKFVERNVSAGRRVVLITVSRASRAGSPRGGNVRMRGRVRPQLRDAARMSV